MELFEEPTEETATTENPAVATPAKQCAECGGDHSRKSSAFCSNKCYMRSVRKKEKELIGSRPAMQSQAPGRTDSSLPLPKVQVADQALQIAFDITRAAAVKWEEWYLAEKKDKEKLLSENQELRDKIRDNEHEKQLNGIEDAKPSLFGKIVSELPEEWRQALAPTIGSIGKFLSNKLDGPANGQLDEASQTLLNWLNSLPEGSQQNVVAILGTLMQVPDETQLNNILGKIIAVLQGGSTLGTEQPKPQQQQQPSMMGLYGN